LDIRPERASAFPVHLPAFQTFIEYPICGEDGRMSVKRLPPPPTLFKFEND
jgi:hypothetical protein